MTGLPEQAEHGERRNARPLILLPVLLAVVALVYWPGMHGGFVFDDHPNIVQNSALHVTWASTWHEWLAAAFSSPASELQRPLAMLTFAVNHAFTGLDPYWMKVTNLAIHLANTALVWMLVRLVLQALPSTAPATSARRTDTVAAWTAAAWALNPINLMAVLFVVQRMESMSHAFVLAGLCLYLSGRTRLLEDGRGWWRILAGLIVGTLLGALAKESAVLLPVYALVLELTLLGFATKRHSLDSRVLALFGGVLVLPAIVGLVWMVQRVRAPGAYAGRDFSLVERVLTEGRVLVDYLRWTLLPDLGQLSLYHDDYVVSRGLLDPPGTLVAFLVIAALLVAAAWVRNRRPLVTLGIGWFLGAHLLTATIWPLELAFEHRNYFASLGVCLLLADLLLRAPRSERLRRAGIAAAIALLVLYAGLTALRALEWNNPLRFALTEVEKHPASPRATYDLARNLVLLTGFDRDSHYLDQAFAALEQARRVPGASALPESAAIVLAARTGRPINPAWWQGMQDKLRAGPVGPEEHNALATLVKCDSDDGCRLPPARMVETFDTALYQGRHPGILSLYGAYALDELHDPGLALQLWREAADLAPTVVKYQAALARLMIVTGRFDAAVTPISRIRASGRFGEHEALATQLERARQAAASAGG